MGGISQTRLARAVRAMELATRPVPVDLQAALELRWQELPDHVKTPAQALGRRSTGCEGTHGVFPRCDLACTPCYHSREANRVRVDGPHTTAAVDAQMGLLRQQRGPGQHAQLIGGEVSLLSPEDHAAALEAMRRHQRKPMSMSHGDFDYDYLRALALATDGTPRFSHLSFAGHFDSMMFGRRGLRRVHDETELNPHRLAFCEMFRRLQREHGVGHYLAHNMTVTPRNLHQVSDVIRDCRGYGFRMFSFQPAAFIGNSARWKDDYREFSDDEVWKQRHGRWPARRATRGIERSRRHHLRADARRASRSFNICTPGGVPIAARRRGTERRTGWTTCPPRRDHPVGAGPRCSGRRCVSLGGGACGLESRMAGA